MVPGHLIYAKHTCLSVVAIGQFRWQMCDELLYIYIYIYISVLFYRCCHRDRNDQFIVPIYEKSIIAVAAVVIGRYEKFNFEQNAGCSLQEQTGPS